MLGKGCRAMIPRQRIVRKGNLLWSHSSLRRAPHLSLNMIHCHLLHHLVSRPSPGFPGQLLLRASVLTVAGLISMEGAGSEVLVGTYAGGSDTAAWMNPKMGTRDLSPCSNRKHPGSAGAPTLMLRGEKPTRSGHAILARIALRRLALWTPIISVLAPVCLLYDGFM